MKEALENIINNFSEENESNTPDFILAEFMLESLKIAHNLIRTRDKWYSIDPEPGWSNPDTRMREAIGAAYTAACILANEGKDIRQVELPAFAEVIVKGLTGRVQEEIK